MKNVGRIRMLLLIKGPHVLRLVRKLMLSTQHTQQGLDTRQIMTDDRMITAEQLLSKVSENNNLLPQQQ